MLRSFIFLLLLIIVFLSGMLIGNDRDKSVVIHEYVNTDHLIERPENLEKEKVLFLDNSKQFLDPIHAEIINEYIEENSVQKIASFLEIFVKGFYEIIVDVLYQISSLFI